MAKILIAEDSEVYRIDLKEALEEGGHEVIEAENGQVGFDKAKIETDIEFIISDYNMPEMNGIEMVKNIKSLENHSNTPCFMLTTEGSTELKKQGKEAGILMWMVKPFNEEKLLKAMDKFLQKNG